MKRKYKILMYVLIIITILTGHSCIRSDNHPGYDYYPDMTNSMAYETYSANNNYPDSSNMQNPLEGTVSRNRYPHYSSEMTEDRKYSGSILKNPLAFNNDILEAGREHYETICIVCHGIEGNGKGLLVTSGKYLYFPADLTRPEVQEFPDGEIFNVITEGFGLMGAHGGILVPAERWEIVHYVKGVLCEGGEVVIKTSEVP